MRMKLWKTKKEATEHAEPDEFTCLECGGNTRSEIVQIRRVHLHSVAFFDPNKKMVDVRAIDSDDLLTHKGYGFCMKCALSGNIPGLDPAKLRAVLANIPDPSAGAAKH